MKYGILLTALWLAGCATTPRDLHQVASQELCVDYAETMITGQRASQPSIADELSSRGEKCQPSDNYLQMAYTRVMVREQKQQALIQSLGAAAQVQKASQPYILQSPMHTSQSTCGWNGNQWQCNSTGN